MNGKYSWHKLLLMIGITVVTSVQMANANQTAESQEKETTDVKRRQIVAVRYETGGFYNGDRKSMSLRGHIRPIPKLWN